MLAEQSTSYTVVWGSLAAYTVVKCFGVYEGWGASTDVELNAFCKEELVMSKGWFARIYWLMCDATVWVSEDESRPHFQVSGLPNDCLGRCNF